MPQDILSVEPSKKKSEILRPIPNQRHLIIMTTTTAPCHNGAFAASPKTVIECDILIFWPPFKSITMEKIVFESIVACPECGTCILIFWEPWRKILPDMNNEIGVEHLRIEQSKYVPRLETILDSGFTSLCEVGGLGKHLKV